MLPSVAPTRPARLHVVVGTTVAAALAVLAVALWRVHLQPSMHLWQVGLLVVTIPLSERALLHVRFGGQHFSFTWGEACLLLGFALVSPAWFVVVAAPLVTAVHLVARRGATKALFNAASFTIASGAAGVVLTTATSAPYQVTDVHDALAMLAAVTVFSLTSAALTARVVSVATGRSWASVVGDSRTMALVVWAGNVLTAGGSLVLAERSQTALWALPPLMLVVWGAYRAYLSAHQERDAWQQLEASARELNRLEEAEVARAALSRARMMFRTDDVVLALPAGKGRVDRVYAFDDSGALQCRPGDPRHDSSCAE
ncbi:MAG: hypothetical protein ACXVFV_11665, partial [Mycobacteriales bacterium]